MLENMTLWFLSSFSIEIKINGKLIIGIKEGKTSLNKVETGISLFKNKFTLEKKEKGKYFDGEKLRNGIFYSLSKV